MKLDITTEYTIWCGRCAHWEQRQSKNKASLSRDARKWGWKIREGKTVCPECAAELAAGQTEVGYRHPGDR